MFSHKMCYSLVQVTNAAWDKSKKALVRVEMGIYRDIKSSW